MNKDYRQHQLTTLLKAIRAVETLAETSKLDFDIGALTDMAVEMAEQMEQEAG